MRIPVFGFELSKPSDTNYHGPKGSTLTSGFLFVELGTRPGGRKRHTYGYRLWWYKKGGRSRYIEVTMRLKDLKG